MLRDRYNDKYTIKAKGGIPFVSCTEEHISEEESFKVTNHHCHSDFEILYIEDGALDLMIAGEVLRAEKGDIAVINPYELHAAWIAGHTVKFLCLDFDIKIIELPDEKELLAEKLKYTHLIKPPLADKLSINLKTANDDYINEPSGWKLSLKGNLLIFFSAITDRLVKSVIDKNNIFAKAVLKFIEDNYAEPITSNEAAESLSYNQSHFCRLFRRNFGTNFSAFLNEYKIKKAKHFLKDMNVSAAAAAAGFNDYSYFSQLFRKYVGTSPTEYKKMTADRRTQQNPDS